MRKEMMPKGPRSFAVEGVSLVLLAFSLLGFSQVTVPATRQDADKVTLIKIISEDGTPLADATIEVISMVDRNEAFKLHTDANGVILLCHLQLPSEFELKITHENCNSIVRTHMRIENLRGKDLAFSMLCGDPPLPKKEHTRTPRVSYINYTGRYRMTIMHNGKQTCDKFLVLYAQAETSEHKCKCKSDWKLAAITANGACSEYGCWRVKEDGDIEMFFPCQGLTFGGSNWTLWKEGDGLVGQASSWSDAGGSRNWEVKLTRTDTQ
jgi:hypothetical protein